MELMQRLFGENWEYVIGEKEVEKPERILFKNAIEAMKILDKHITNNRSTIVVHSDIDGDGLGCAYIIHSIFQHTGVINRSSFVINKDRIHGIGHKQVEVLNELGYDLLLVLDSSTDSYEEVKEFNGDVIVIDHHTCRGEKLEGDTHGGKFIVVNNTLDYEESVDNVEKLKKLLKVKQIESYKAEPRMSCGLVVYEFLRVYLAIKGKEKLLENLMLYQWVGVTLFTDIIELNTLRNQWYVNKTVNSLDIESTLYTLMKGINKYNKRLDKSFISFYLSPMFNRAIRAGHSSEVLSIVLDNPKDIDELEEYREVQERILFRCFDSIEIQDGFIKKDLTDTDISTNYCGVIAAKLCDYYNKNAICYKVNNRIAKGSFRGRYLGVDYQSILENVFGEGEKLEVPGHGRAFGFEIEMDKLDLAMQRLVSKEAELKSKVPNIITAGRVKEYLKGIHHIEDMGEFKKQGSLIKIALANARLSGDEAIKIIMDKEDVELLEESAVYKYDALGIRCIAFERIESRCVELYAEYGADLNMYLRNTKIGEALKCEQGY